MKKYTVDRIEDGKIAVLLLRDNETVEKNAPISSLPSDVKEGDILEVSFNKDGNVDNARVMKQETRDALSKAEALLEKLKKKNID